MSELSSIDTKTLSLIIGAIRKSFSYHSPQYAAALRAASVRSGPRNGFRYKCVGCLELFEHRMVHVDHRDPCIPVDKTANEMTLQELYSRVFCELSNLDVLCKKCHRDKTLREAQLRAQFRKLKKPAKVTPKKKAK